MRPLASSWIIGITSNRVGTRYYYTVEEALKDTEKKGFRWLKAGLEALSSMRMKP